jgi:hypothetical protein
MDAATDTAPAAVRTIYVELPADEHKKLKLKAVTNNTTMSRLVREKVRELLAEDRPAAPADCG